MGPADFFRGRLDNIRAHPFQNLASTVFGGFVPGGGIAANALFNRYNDSRFNNSAQQFQDRSADLSNLNTNASMNDPLGGPLGDYDRANPNGEAPSGGTGGRAQQDRQLGEALMGGGGGQNAGGPMGGMGYQPIGGWSQATMSGWNPNQANGSQAFGLLDFLGQNPNTPFNLPTTPSGHLTPADRRDAAQGGYGPGNYGVSNFMVGGSPVIFGSGDPNGRYRNRGSQYGG